MTGVGEGDGVGVGEADGVGEGDGAGTGTGVGEGDAVGPGLGVGVGLEIALLPLLAALEELPPQPTNPNKMHAKTAMARYLNIRAALVRVRYLDFGNLGCSRVPAGCLALKGPDCRLHPETARRAQVSPVSFQSFEVRVPYPLRSKGWIDEVPILTGPSSLIDNAG